MASAPETESFELVELPRKIVERLIRQQLPDKVHVADNAKLALFKALPLFAGYLTGSAANVADMRLTGNPAILGAEDVLDALDRVLELGDLVPAVREKVSAYAAHGEKGKKRAPGENGVVGSDEDDYDEDEDEEMEDAGALGSPKPAAYFVDRSKLKPGSLKIKLNLKREDGIILDPSNPNPPPPMAGGKGKGKGKGAKSGEPKAPRQRKPATPKEPKPPKAPKEPKPRAPKSSSKKGTPAGSVSAPPGDVSSCFCRRIPFLGFANLRRCICTSADAAAPGPASRRRSLEHLHPDRRRFLEHLHPGRRRDPDSHPPAQVAMPQPVARPQPMPPRPAPAQVAPRPVSVPVQAPAAPVPQPQVPVAPPVRPAVADQPVPMDIDSQPQGSGP
ncbi:hypothetical protein DFJ74DRAFT_765528 [Hyaloraphidium curvatum]|nr:hypothetical protein DFJ74DRAFT_765528 [Hyaloraphidium curvatum]